MNRPPLQGQLELKWPTCKARTRAHTRAASTPPLPGTRPNQRSKAGFVKLMAAALQPGTEGKERRGKKA